MASRKKPRKKSSQSAKKTPKINPDDVGVSKEEADAIIAELDDMTDEEIEAGEDET